MDPETPTRKRPRSPRNPCEEDQHEKTILLPTLTLSSCKIEVLLRQLDADSRTLSEAVTRTRACDSQVQSLVTKEEKYDAAKEVGDGSAMLQGGAVSAFEPRSSKHQKETDFSHTFSYA